MIKEWLQEFRENWKNQEVEEVLELFTDDVTYYETPTEKLSPEELEQEWKEVKQQEDIQLELDLFSSDGNKHTVQWELSYRSKGEKNHLKGIYLIKLNENGKCKEFWQYIQQE
jgi:ketosteroid isomerase-like protein